MTTPPLRTSIWYPVIAEPPVFTGAVQLTVLEITPAVAVGAVAATPVGAPGAVVALGVTAVEAAELALAPTRLTARTTNVTAVPFVRPVTTWLGVALVNVTDL